MAAVSKQLIPEHSPELEGYEVYGTAAAVMRRALAFPVKGCKFLPIERKSWYKPLQRKQSMKGQ